MPIAPLENAPQGLSEDREASRLRGTRQSADVLRLHDGLGFQMEDRPRSGLGGPAEVVSIFTGRGPPEQSPSSDWRRTVETEFRELLDAARSKGESLPSKNIRAVTRQIIRICAASYPLPLPTIEFDENGNVEFFIRTRSDGVLVVVRGDDLLQIFGDSEGEPWRSRYQLTGRMWRSHLRTILRPLTTQAAEAKRA